MSVTAEGVTFAWHTCNKCGFDFTCLHPQPCVSVRLPYCKKCRPVAYADMSARLLKGLWLYPGSNVALCICGKSLVAPASGMKGFSCPSCGDGGAQFVNCAECGLTHASQQAVSLCWACRKAAYTKKFSSPPQPEKPCYCSLCTGKKHIPA